MINLNNEDQIIIRYGKYDGYDQYRMDYAKECSRKFDRPLSIMFESIIKLEEKGMIKLNIPPITIEES